VSLLKAIEVLGHDSQGVDFELINVLLNMKQAW